ncbi:hypothetical protein [Streptomyces sp. NPDC046805]|uniref:hypothetical protein n=1 Tax=Streptomyces sp. NPDC046805 TaxID=3155134 RepID=UPI0033E235CE
MHIFLVVAAVLAVAVYAAAGVAAVAAGWMPPLARRNVVRARLWGYGALLSAFGLGLYLFLGPLEHHMFNAVPVIGWCVWMGGMVMSSWAQRPGRDARRNAS